MIAFKDFIPKRVEGTGDLEDIENVLERVNNYIFDNGVRVINLETVVLPNVEHTGDSELQTPEGEDSTWVQFLRLWFEE